MTDDDTGEITLSESDETKIREALAILVTTDEYINSAKYDLDWSLGRAVMHLEERLTGKVWG